MAITDIIYCEELKREHCWHDDLILHAHMSSDYRQYCCFCGKTRSTSPAYGTPDPVKHGPHLKATGYWPKTTE